MGWCTAVGVVTERAAHLHSSGQELEHIVRIGCLVIKLIINKQFQFTNIGSLKLLFTLLYRLTTMIVIKGRRGKTELLAFLMRRLWWESQDM